KLSGIMGDFGKGLKNFKDQVKSNKETEETELINEVPEKKVKPNKRKTSAKSSPKKKATKNKS
ncbi:twin-arginine translocase TatA/TatE family subunit, partial [Alphaproteobacteria bacterium]|nr:twin-arginine translocase TatA/TatE family subunit [Alphaproteobacteria bacterium]